MAERPSRARVLERAGIDYCCHGGRRLVDAATEAGLDPGALAAALAVVTDTEGAHIDRLDPVSLVEHEAVLFPAIRRAADGPTSDAFRPLSEPIGVLLAEHDRAGDLLAALRQAAGDYVVPDDGCASYRSLYERLAHLEADTHRHIHLENNVLFPAVAGTDQLGSSV